MRLRLFINGLDYSGAALVDSLNLTQDSTEAISTAEFDVIAAGSGTGAYDSAEYDNAYYDFEILEYSRVELKDADAGDQLVFAGLVAAVDRRADDKYLVWGLRCVDWGVVLDRSVMSQSWPDGTTDAQIVKDVCARLDSSWGIVADPLGVFVIANNLGLFEAKDQTAREILEAVCDLTGGEWHVTYDKKVRYYKPGSFVSAFGLSDQPDGFATVGFAVDSYNRDFTRAANRVTVLGAVQPSGNEIAITLTDPTSQVQFGVLSRTIVDRQLTDGLQVHMRAFAELQVSAFPQTQLQVQVYAAGAARGQTIHVKTGLYGIDADLIVRTVGMNVIAPNRQLRKVDGLAHQKVRWHITLGSRTPDFIYALRRTQRRAAGSTKAPATVIPPGSIGPGDLLPGFGGIITVDVLPALPDAAYSATAVVFLTTDRKLYRRTGNSWTAYVDAEEIEGQITTPQLAPGSVISTVLADGAVVSAKIPTGAIVADKLGPGAVTVPAIAVGAVTVPAIAVGAVTAPAISAAAVTAPAIAASAIEADKIAANAVTAGKVAADAIAANNIQAGAVVADKIGANAVTAGKVAADAIAANNIQAGAVVADKIGANAVTAGKVAADAISANNIQAGAVGADEIQAGAITANKIAAGAVEANAIAANAIAAIHIQANAIVAGKVAANAIVAGNIAALAVQAGNLAADSVIAGNVAAAAIQVGDLAANSVLAGNISAHAIQTIHLDATEIQLGYGAGRCGQLTVWNASATVAVLGDLSASPGSTLPANTYFGIWAKLAGFGGTKYSDAPIYTDVNGNLFIRNTGFTVTSADGTVLETSPTVFDPTYNSLALRISKALDSSTSLVTRGLIIYSPAGRVVGSLVRSPSNNDASELTIYGPTGSPGKFISLDGMTGRGRFDGGVYVGATQVINSSGQVVGAISATDMTLTGYVKADGGFRCQTYTGMNTAIRVLLDGGGARTMTFVGGLLISITS